MIDLFSISIIIYAQIIYFIIFYVTVGVECGDCSLAWLIRDNRPLLEPIVDGRCNNGTSFSYLDPNGYNGCPPT